MLMRLSGNVVVSDYLSNPSTSHQPVALSFFALTVCGTFMPSASSSMTNDAPSLDGVGFASEIEYPVAPPTQPRNVCDRNAGSYSNPLTDFASPSGEAAFFHSKVMRACACAWRT